MLQNCPLSLLSPLQLNIRQPMAKRHRYAIISRQITFSNYSRTKLRDLKSERYQTLEPQPAAHKNLARGTIRRTLRCRVPSRRGARLKFAKNNHYVPRSHLRNWAGPDGLVAVYS